MKLTEAQAPSAMTDRERIEAEIERLGKEHRALSEEAHRQRLAGPALDAFLKPQDDLVRRAAALRRELEEEKG